MEDGTGSKAAAWYPFKLLCTAKVSTGYLWAAANKSVSCALLTSISAVAFGVRTPPKSATHHCGGSGSDSCINVVVSIALVQVQVQALCKPQVAGYNIRSSSARLACTTGALVLAPPGRRGTGPRLCHTPRMWVQTASLH